jgi:hypothetical protein
MAGKDVVVPTPRKLQIRKDVLAQIMSNCGNKKTKWTEEVRARSKVGRGGVHWDAAVGQLQQATPAPCPTRVRCAGG